jgi:glycerol-3-phosphate acyltransferase PlsX
MTTIAVDAMGGDNAPRVEVEGALEAARVFGARIILVGREPDVRKELDRHAGWKSLPVEVRHASEVITMDDSAAKAVRAKKDSSMRVASRLVRDGHADGFVSAGNTGAAMATAKMVQGIVHGVERPALATTLPTRTGRPAVLLDVGANVDSTPKMLAQFAVMGDIYARNILHVRNPRVALLSIGEEEHKGNELTKAATPLLKSLPLNFTGNCEGRDLFRGEIDVVVCDGFTGNVALKVSEGVADVIKFLLRESLGGSLAGKAGAFLARGGFREFKRRVDYSEWGGAPLLGVKGVCIICHGSSNANAIKNAIRVASEFAEEKLNAKIENELLRWTAPELATPAD